MFEFKINCKSVTRQRKSNSVCVCLAWAFAALQLNIVPLSLTDPRAVIFIFLKTTSKTAEQTNGKV